MDLGLLGDIRLDVSGIDLEFTHLGGDDRGGALFSAKDLDTDYAKIRPQLKRLSYLLILLLRTLLFRTPS